VAFRELPVDSRYRFLLDEARNSIMSFIKGPVCRGQAALNVINDHFWVFFVDPDSQEPEEHEKFLDDQANRLDLPAAKGEIFNLVESWIKYSKKQRAYLDARAKAIHEDYGRSRMATIDIFWDGDGENQNAALTIFRHFDSATVERGLLGGKPKTAWLISYPLLERIHYLLVAGFDVFGNVGHQLMTRVYMDFLRMEGEMNFLYFIPEPARTSERDFWYRGADEKTIAYLKIPREQYDVEPAIHYETDDPKSELYDILTERLAPVLPEEHTLEAARSDEARSVVEQLQALPAPAASLLPEVAYVELRLASGSEHLTLVRNSAHENITALFDEDATRRPEEDYVSAVPGFVGAYPNVFLVVPGEDAQGFVDAVTALASEADYGALLDRYGVRRTDPRFWEHADGVHAALRALDPVDAGQLDFNRLENR